jgi:mono/diheme cytochrome c family protein
MKNHLREQAGFAAIFFSLALFLLAFSVARSEDLAGGKKIFEGKCAQCHGKDAKGVAKMAKVLKVEPVVVDLTRDEAVKLSNADKVKTVTEGKKKMPKYKGKLTDEQIQGVVKYLESLQGAGKKN